MSTFPPLRARALHLSALAGFAIAQPVFDQVSRNPAILGIWRAGALEIVTLALGLSVGVPAFLLLLEWAVPTTGSKRIVHLGFVAVLVALFLAPIAARAIPQSSTGAAVAAATLGVCAAIAYDRAKAVQGLCSALSIAVPVFVATFLWSAPVREFWSSEQKLARAGGLDIPVVVVVFDEFPLLALVDTRGQIDASRFPNFARLARGSTWFRNATTVASSTESAVPSILTGRAPERRPNWRAIQQGNLFTLLSESHDLRVVESYVPYCPLELCPGETGGRSSRLLLFLRDTGIVYLQVVSPPAWRSSLPELSQPILLNEGGQVADPGVVSKTAVRARNLREHGGRHRAEALAKFLGTLGPSTKPALYYLHVLLPHAPSEFLPSGRACPRLNDPSDWNRFEESAVREAYVRFLQQLQFVDQFMGQLIDRLESAGLHDEALLVVTADHGSSFQVGTLRRSLTVENECNILPVPLFLKSPRQKQGQLRDDNVEILDVLPTIADTLEIDVPWHLDGESLLGEQRSPRERKTIYGPFTNDEIPYFETTPVTRSSRFVLECFERSAMTSLVAGQPSGDPLFAEGPYAKLAGREITSLERESTGSMRASVANLGLYEDLAADETFFPCMVSGQVFVATGAAAPEKLDLALAVNGRIAAVTRAKRVRQSTTFEFAVPVPEAWFRSRGNEIEVFSIGGDPMGMPRLTTLSQEAANSFDLREPGGSLEIVPRGKSRIPVQPGAITGAVYEVSPGEVSTLVRGWALTTEGHSPVEMILAFRGSRFVHLARTDRNRPELVRRYGAASARAAGFEFELPRTGEHEEETPLRIFGISRDGVAGELPFQPPPVPETMRLSPSAVRPEIGHAFIIQLPGEWVEFGSSVRTPRKSTLQLREDGRPMGPGNAAHSTIRNEGRGAYSHWGGALYFSSSDNSDPGTNGRTYEIEILTER